MRRTFFTFFIICIAFYSTVVFAQIPKIMNYQGVLLEANERPVQEGQYKLTFTIYTEDGTSLWQEVQDHVFISGGMFHVILGSVTPLNLPFDRPYLLGVKVNNGAEMQPRMPLTTSPFSFHAINAEKVAGVDVSATPAPNKLLPLDANGKFPSSVIPGGGGGSCLRKDAPDSSHGVSDEPMLSISNEGGGIGLYGKSVSQVGVFGESREYIGVFGKNSNSGAYGALGLPESILNVGVYGSNDNGDGVEGQSMNGNGVYGVTGGGAPESAGVYGYSQETNGVKGKSVNGIGVNGGSENGNGVVGWTGTQESGAHCGVLGWSVKGVGVRGTSEEYNGIQATTNSDKHAALAAGNNGGGPAIYAQGGSNGVAAVFRGNVQVQSLATQATIIELGEGLDYAEGFDVTGEQEIAPGTILVIDDDNPGRLTMSRAAYDRKVAGIVAGANGLKSGVRLGVDKFACDVALAGRVYCKVDATYGSIAPGDLLTTSPTPGYAMVVRDHRKARGAILGKAMQALPKGEKGKILVLVTLQ